MAGGGTDFGADLTVLTPDSAPGRGASQIAHFSVADALFLSIQESHVQSPVFVDAAGLIPAAAQLNDCGVDGDDVEGNADVPFVFVVDEATGMGFQKSYFGVSASGAAAAAFRASG